MKKIFLLFSGLLLLLTAQSQEVWTLEKCIDHALTNNLQVKQQLLMINNAKTSLLQSKLNMLPSLNAGVQHGYNFGKTVDRYTNDFATKTKGVQSDNFYLGSQITLWDGFQKVNQWKQNMHELDAARFDSDKFMDDISLGIATAYLQILFYKESLATAEKQLEATRLQAERLKKLVDAGALAQGDYYAILAQQAAENVAVVDARNNLDLSTLTLVQMLDLPGSDGFTIESPDLELGQQPAIVAMPDQVFQYALETQPQIKSAESKVRSSEYGLAIAKGMQYPTLTMSASLATGYSGAAQMLGDTAHKVMPIGYTMLNGVPSEIVYSSYVDYTYKDKPFKDQVNDNINKSLSFSLNIPIFNGWATRTAVSKAKINMENSMINLELSKMQLRKTIEQAYADSKAALNKYQSSVTGVDASRESYRYAEQKFNVGVMNSVDYNNAKKDYEKAESELIRAKYEFIFKSTVLDFYMGKPISLKRK